jgi:phosphoribosylaminoimidazolecarboxamide formyltransferase/IMP cyclohydrolase
MPDLIPIRRALLSVSDKTGIVELASQLHAWGVELLSTGGTAAALRAAGLPVVSVSDVTGFPEILGGRVKTLHPHVHAGLLANRDDPEHMQQLAAHGIAPIELVVINLYPFEQTVARAGVTHEQAIEQIDIGGPAMLRASAKNADSVAVCVQPSRYPALLEHMAAHQASAGQPATTRELRRELARAVFARTAAYDASISNWLERRAAEDPACQAEGGALPARLIVSLERVQALRYGENPHQSAAVYRATAIGQPLDGTGTNGNGSPAAGTASLVDAPLLHGKPLSYNNLNDAAAALRLVMDLHALDPRRPAAVIVKHTNPCGAATATDALTAVDAAFAGDPVAAFGGILATSATLTGDVAQRLCAEGVFLEVVIAPEIAPDALERLRSRWANLRIMAVGPLPAQPPQTLELRTLPGGALAQGADAGTPLDPGVWTLAAGPAPDAATIQRAAVVWLIAKHLTSNAIAIGGADPQRPGAVRLFGAGAGQMDRVTSSRLAAEKAGALAQGAVAASDAFFPFDDGPRVLADAGVRAIVHPGGSKRDQDTFTLCEQRGISCLLTGTRHFRH